MSTHDFELPRTGSETKNRGLLQAAATTAVAATVGNLVIWAIATAAIDVPDRFTPLQPGSVVFMTVLGVALAAVAFKVVAGRSATPVETFRRIVPVALLVSFVPDALIWAADGYEGAAEAKTVLPLMAMHVLAGAAVYFLLPSGANREGSAR